MKSEAPSSVESGREKVFRGTTVTFLGRISQNGIRLATQLAIARMLGAGGMGLYALGISLYSIGELVAMAGLQEGAVRFISVYSSGNQHGRVKGVLLQSLAVPLVLGSLIGCAMYLTADTVSVSVFAKPELAGTIRLFSLAVPLGAAMSVLSLNSTGFHTARYMVIVLNFLQPAANLALLLFLVVMGFGLSGAVFAWVLSMGLGLLLSGKFIIDLFPRLLSTETKPVFEFKKLMGLSLPLASGSILWFLLLWTDTLILGHYRPAEDVGLYRAASQIGLMLILFTGSLSSLLLPMIANLYAKGEIREVGELFKTTTRWSTSVCVPLFIIILVAGGELLRLFGPGFETAWAALILIGLGQMVNAMTGEVSGMLSMTGHQMAKLWGDVTAAVLNIVLNILLIPRWGIIGAAVATGASLAVVNVIRLVQVYRLLNCHPFKTASIKPLAAGSVAFVAAYWFKQSVPDWNFLIVLTAAAAVAVAAYATGMAVLGVEGEDRRLYREIVNKSGMARTG